MIDGIPLNIADLGGWGAFILAVAVFVLAVFRDRIWTRARAIAAISAAEKQRDDAMDALRDAIEVNRLHAENGRDDAESLRRLAESSEVSANFIRAFPSPRRDYT